MQLRVRNHHGRPRRSHARGSVALKGALETELYVERKKGMCGTITVTKQKNAPDGEEFPTSSSPSRPLVVRIGAETPGTADPFMRPAGLITGKSSYPKRVAWVLWETWHDTGGATKAEVEESPQGEPGPHSAVQAVRRGVLRRLVRPGARRLLGARADRRKHLLSTKGIHELRFTSELLEYVRKQRGHRGPGGVDEYSGLTLRSDSDCGPRHTLRSDSDRTRSEARRAHKPRLRPSDPSESNRRADKLRIFLRWPTPRGARGSESHHF